MVTETTPSARRGEFDQFAALVPAVDQLSIDVAPDRFDSEYEFWAAVTGWETQAPRSGEFRAFGRPPGMPLRFLFQRRVSDDVGLDATCHLDFACDDIVAAERYTSISARPSSPIGGGR